MILQKNPNELFGWPNMIVTADKQFLEVIQVEKRILFLNDHIDFFLLGSKLPQTWQFKIT